jgi:hypothetical protein
MCARGLRHTTSGVRDFCRFRVQANDDLSALPRPKEHRWVSEWAETRVGAEMRRVGIEKRFAPRKIEVAVERFEFNPGKSNIVRFLNERSSSHGQFHSTPQETITDMVNRAL